MPQLKRLVSPLAKVIVSFLVVGAVGNFARAADTAAQQMAKLDGQALDDYSAGNFDKAKTHLLQAVALAKKDATLQSDPVMARTLMSLGALYVDGFEDRKTGISYFVQALRMKPDIEIADSLVTKTVTSALAEAKQEAAGSAPEAAPLAGTTAAARPAAAKESPGEPMGSPPSDKVSTAAARDDKRADAESKQRAAAAAVERDKLEKARVAAETSAATEREAKERLTAEKKESDKSLTESKALVLQLQKEKSDRDKAVATEREKAQKDLAALKDSESKERAAKEKLATEKQATEKALADAKAQVQQLQKEKAEKEKQLAETAAREKAEREAKERLIAEKQAADGRDKARKAEEDAARARREKLAAGPDVPNHFAEPVYCTVPDEVPAGAELFVHCVAKPSLGAKTIAFYYRSNASPHFNSVELEPGKKGWQTTVIPASQVSGKALQYYVEALDSHGSVAASNGKAVSPNILALRPVAGGFKSATYVKRR